MFQRIRHWLNSSILLQSHRYGLVLLLTVVQLSYPSITYRYFDLMTSFDCRILIIQSLDLLMKFIVSNHYSFSIVEEEPFRDFCKSLNPKSRMISGTTIKKKISQAYWASKEEVKNHLVKECTGRASFTTDLWTSGNKMAFMAVTCTFLTNEFVMIQVTLGFREVLEADYRHNGENTCTVFLNILNDFGLQDKVSQLDIY